MPSIIEAMAATKSCRLKQYLLERDESPAARQGVG
jgi:hypothetical protein